MAWGCPLVSPVSLVWKKKRSPTLEAHPEFFHRALSFLLNHLFRVYFSVPPSELCVDITLFTYLRRCPPHISCIPSKIISGYIPTAQSWPTHLMEVSLRPCSFEMPPNTLSLPQRQK